MCKFAVFDCPSKCGCAKLKRAELATHQSEKCPLVLVNCTYEKVGCNEQMLRKDLHKHEEIQAHKHLLLVSMANDKVLKENDKALVSINADCEIMMMKKFEEITALKTQLKSVEDTTAQMQSSLLEMEKKLDSLKQNGDAREECCQITLNAKRKQLHYLHDESGATFAEFQTIPVPSGDYFTPPVTFKVENFKGLKSNNEVWYSPPFYTHVGGYKMCLSIYPNGLGAQCGTHVSLYVHMMTGEFDAYLNWPFAGAFISITALSQRNIVVGHILGKKNVGACIEYFGNSTKQSRARVYNVPRGEGYGTPCFIKHSSLKRLLENDCLHVKVYNIEFFPL